MTNKEIEKRFEFDLEIGIFTPSIALGDLKRICFKYSRNAKTILKTLYICYKCDIIPKFVYNSIRGFIITSPFSYSGCLILNIEWKSAYLIKDPREGLEYETLIYNDYPTYINDYSILKDKFHRLVMMIRRFVGRYDKRRN